MKNSFFEFGISKGRYYKKAGEIIDIYATEHEVKIDTTEELVKSVAKATFLFDILKEAIRVGGALGSAALALMAKEYVVTMFAGRLLAKAVGMATLVSIEMNGLWDTVKRARDVEQIKKNYINKLLEEAIVGTEATDISDKESTEDKPEVVEAEIVDEKNAEDTTTKFKFRWDWDDVVGKLMSFGIAAYIVMGLANWALDILSKALAFPARARKLFVS